MNEQLTQQLNDEFPLLYRGRKLGMQKNLMCFGFAHGDGWFQPIYDLSKKLEARLVELQKMGVPEKELGLAMQVKEKFGGLRFYTSGRFYIEKPEKARNTVEEHPLGVSMTLGKPVADFSDWIDQAEAECAKMCEECGAQPAKLRGGGWIRTLCDEHGAGRPELKYE